MGRNDQGIGAKRPGSILEVNRRGTKRLGGGGVGLWNETFCYRFCPILAGHFGSMFCTGIIDNKMFSDFIYIVWRYLLIYSNQKSL